MLLKMDLINDPKTKLRISNNSRSFLIFCLPIRICIGDHGTGFAQTKTKLAEKSLALPYSESNTESVFDK